MTASPAGCKKIVASVSFDKVLRFLVIAQLDTEDPFLVSLGRKCSGNVGPLRNQNDPNRQNGLKIKHQPFLGGFELRFDGWALTAQFFIK